MMVPLPNLTSVIIESDRLRLLPTSEAYAEDIFASFTASVTAFMHPAPPTAIGDTIAFLHEAHAQLLAGTDLQVAIVLVETGEFLGHGGLHHLDGSSPELGIWIKEDAHGHHYGREAVTALCGWALGNLDFDYLKYPVDRRNVASRRIPESLGGQIEAEYVRTNEFGRTLNLVEYRLYPAELRQRLGAGE